MILDIVKVREDAPQEIQILTARIAPGSVLVVIERNGQTILYFEGGIYSRGTREPTNRERMEYAKIAAGRAIENYPTTAKIFLPNQECLDVVGHVDTDSWEVSFARS